MGTFVPLFFRLRSVFGKKTFEILTENVIFFGPNVRKLGCASEWVKIVVRRKKSQKKVEFSGAELNSSFFWDFFASDTHGHMQRDFFGCFFFCKKWSTMDIVFFLFSFFSLYSLSPFFVFFLKKNPKKISEKKNLARAQEGLRLPFPLARQVRATAEAP